MRRRAEFAATVRGGRRAAAGSVLVVHCRVSPDDTPARVGFIVGRTVGSAVARNRVRRRLRHLMRDRLGALPPGATLVVRANPAAVVASSSQLAAAVDGAVARAVAAAGEPA